MAGIFESIVNAFGGGGGAASLLGSVIEGAGAYFGAKQTADANREAAERVAEAERARAAAAQAQADQIKQGNLEAQARFETQQQQAQPGVSRLQQITTGAATLTPEQQAQLEELRRSSLNTLSRSGLRGSGRAVTESLRNVESDFTNRALGTNLARADSAATNLSNQGFAAGTRAAQTDVDIGRALGAGTAGAAGFNADAAITEAGADVANAQLRGAAIGDISSIIASEAKGRDSKYGDIRRKFRQNMSLRDIGTAMPWQGRDPAYDETNSYRE